ncbi:unnamed protein product [Closterium sp. Naga37s-1]|nr:unnamed protein product [Closterium sp. Naga37s-1]
MADGGWGVRRRLAIWESRADSFRDKSSADPVRTSTSGSGAPGAPSGAPAQYGASTAVGSTATANGGRRWEQWDRTYDNVHFSTPRDGQFGGPGASSSYVPEDPRYTPTGNPPGYPVDWKPKEVFFKFRQRFMQYKLGANVELRRRLDPPQLSTTSLSPKAPVAPKHNPLSLWGFQVRLGLVWRVVFEPQRGDIRFLTRKIPIMGLLNLQVGIGHDFRHNATGWKWKLTSVLISSPFSLPTPLISTLIPHPSPHPPPCACPFSPTGGHWARFQAQRDGVEVVTHLTKVPTSLPLSLPIPILPSHPPPHPPFPFPPPFSLPTPPLLSHRRA